MELCRSLIGEVPSRELSAFLFLLESHKKLNGCQRINRVHIAKDCPFNVEMAGDG